MPPNTRKIASVPFIKISDDVFGLACCQVACTIEAKLRTAFPLTTEGHDKSWYAEGVDDIDPNKLISVDSSHVDAMRRATTICIREKISMQDFRLALDTARNLTTDLDKLCTLASKSEYFDEVVQGPLRNMIVKLVMDE